MQGWTMSSEAEQIIKGHDSDCEEYHSVLSHLDYSRSALAAVPGSGHNSVYSTRAPTSHLDIVQSSRRPVVCLVLGAFQSRSL